jgi:hypothetical protein
VAGRVPTYDDFAERAREIAAAIPHEFTADVEDVVVHRGVKRHPQIPDIVTLGECEGSPLAAMTGSGLVRSIVHLWYGSFVDLARRDETFDVDAELRETIEHEVKHHLEDKAGTRSLEDEDDLFDAHQRFLEGLDVPPGWYRFGRRLEPNVWAVDLDLFVELRLRRKEFEALRGKPLSMKILGEPFEVEVPADAVAGEALTYEGEGLVDEDGDEPEAPPKEGEEGPPAGDLHLIPRV